MNDEWNEIKIHEWHLGFHSELNLESNESLVLCKRTCRIIFHSNLWIVKQAICGASLHSISIIVIVAKLRRRQVETLRKEIQKNKTHENECNSFGFGTNRRRKRRSKTTPNGSKSYWPVHSDETNVKPKVSYPLQIINRPRPCCRIKNFWISFCLFVVAIWSTEHELIGMACRVSHSWLEAIHVTWTVRHVDLL